MSSPPGMDIGFPTAKLRVNKPSAQWFSNEETLITAVKMASLREF